VLWRGEPGVGKEHVARMIHLESDVKQAAFVPLDCASLSPFDLKQTLKRLFQMSGRQESSGPPEPLPGTLWLKNVEHLPRDLQELIVEQMAQLSASAAPLKGDAPRRPRLMAATTADTER